MVSGGGASGPWKEFAVVDLDPTATAAASGLAFAVIASSHAPSLLLDGSLCIAAASLSFGSAFQIDATPGAAFLELGAGEWNGPQLKALLQATAAGGAGIEDYEMDLERAGKSTRRLVLTAQRLVYPHQSQVWVLVSVTDVTHARHREKAKDALLLEKGVLLREVQHRTANSLQIIASLLLQSARQAPVEEARLPLQTAHGRVMSFAVVQKQLAMATLDEVELDGYLQDLCAGISGSMIDDSDRLSLTVNCDDSVVSASQSISLGLIVTEMVINAIKHAFPDGRCGEIQVLYRSDPSGWILVVSDNGVGQPKVPEQIHVGLGSGIIQALAAQLDAKVEVSEGDPGTIASVLHSHMSADILARAAGGRVGGR